VSTHRLGTRCLDRSERTELLRHATVGRLSATLEKHRTRCEPRCGDRLRLRNFTQTSNGISSAFLQSEIDSHWLTVCDTSAIVIRSRAIPARQRLGRLIEETASGEASQRCVRTASRRRLDPRRRQHSVATGQVTGLMKQRIPTIGTGVRNAIVIDGNRKPFDNESNEFAWFGRMK